MTHQIQIYISNFVLIRLTSTSTDESRQIIQFHYTTWPDFGVPRSPLAFLKFLRDVRQSDAFGFQYGPPIVHCSAGIGRSGTFCLVDSCLILVLDYLMIWDCIVFLLRFLYRYFSLR